MNRHFKIALLLLIMLFQTSVQAASINWRTYSEKVFAEARQEKKPILLYGQASWCPYCHRMNATFATPAIANMVTKNFIPVMIDVDDSPTIATRYNIMTLPTIVILDDSNSVLDTFIGYSDPDDFASKIKSYVRQ